jgi:hypothetical protein
VTEGPRNPFRNEADAFRVLVMFFVGAAIVIAAAALIHPIVGIAIGLVLLGVGAWRAWGLWQDWGEPRG